MAIRINQVLTLCQPFPGNVEGIRDLHPGWERFDVRLEESNYYMVYDAFREMEVYIHRSVLQNDMFSLGKWYAERCALGSRLGFPWYVAIDWLYDREMSSTLIGKPMETRAEYLLEEGAPFDQEVGSSLETRRFTVTSKNEDLQHYLIHNHHRELVSFLPKKLMEDYNFNILNWYRFRLAQFELDNFDFLSTPSDSEIDSVSDASDTTSDIEEGVSVAEYVSALLTRMASEERHVTLNAMQVDQNKYPAVQRTSATVKDKTRLLPSRL